PGSHMSSRTTSKDFLCRRSRQASPLSVALGLYPSSSSTACKDSRMEASSSTIRTLSMLGCAYRGDRSNRQFDDEPGAGGLILLDTNRALMIFDDSADDRQA